MKLKHFLLIIYCGAIIIMHSCTTRKTNDFTQQSDCLTLFRKCDSISTWDSTQVNFEENLFHIKWLVRKNEIKSANQAILISLSFCKSFDCSDDLFSELIFLKHLTNQDEYNINEINNDLSFLNKDYQISYINLLQLKSTILRDISDINYSYATSLYAEYLTTKLTESEKTKLYFLPWSIHAINAIRDPQNHITARHFLRKFECSTCKTPEHLYMNLLNLVPLTKISRGQANEIRQEISKYNFFAPKINKKIETHIDFSVSDPQYAIEKLENRIAKNKNEISFDHLYLVDKHLEIDNLDEAKKVLDKLSNSIDLYGYFKTMYYYRIQEYYYLSYKQTKNISSLKNIYQASIDIVKSYEESETEILNEHYADAIYRANNLLLESIYQLHNTDLSLSKTELITQLSRIKETYSTIASSKNVLRGKTLSGESVNSISKIKFRIDQLEKNVSNYQDTIFQDLKIYKDIYFNYQELNEQFDRIDIQENSLKKSSFTNLLLQSGDQILDFVKTDSAYYITCISSEDVKIEKINKELIEESISELKDYFQKKTDLSKSTLIIWTIIKDLVEGIDNLYIVPDGKLFEVPFEFLTLDTSTIIKDINITYLTNISDYWQNDQSYIASDASIFSYSSQNTIYDNRPKDVPEQKTGLLEAESIATLYQKHNLVSGNQMTIENVFDNLDSPILHFSSHATSSTTNQLDNYIYVREVNKNSSIPLYGFHLKTNELKENLVILSACNSGTGVQKPGTGVFSLSRDFLQAGAQTVIKSLWAVNEASTKELMVEMHRNFTNGQSIGEALFNAKRTVKKIPGYEHPFYWAGFVLEGNPHVYLDLEENCEDTN